MVAVSSAASGGSARPCSSKSFTGGDSNGAVFVAGKTSGVQASDVLVVLDALRSAGVVAWLDGGWGIDALLGVQTRDHQDLDVVVELGRFDAVLSALAPLDFAVVEDHLPTRAVLRSADRGQIDVHPVTFDDEGTGWQKNAGPDGADCPYPAAGFGRGRVEGRAVRCLTAELQIEHHRGYEPRDRDRIDLARLAAAYRLDLPEPYR